MLNPRLSKLSLMKSKAEVIEVLKIRWGGDMVFRLVAQRNWPDQQRFLYS